VMLERSLVIFLVALSLHNLEEALYLPQWGKSIGLFVSTGEFLIVVIILTFIAFFSAFMMFRKGLRGRWACFTLGYAFAMFANVFLPHLLATFYFQRYMPGTATAILFVLPASYVFMSQGLRNRCISRKGLLLVGGGVSTIMAIALPLIFFL